MYKPSTKPVTLTRPTPYSTVQAEAGAWTVVGLAVAFLFHSIFVFGYLPAPSRALSLESRRRTNHYQSGQPSAYISHCSPPVRSWRSCFEAAVTRDTSPQHLAPPGALARARGPTPPQRGYIPFTARARAGPCCPAHCVTHCTHAPRLTPCPRWSRRAWWRRRGARGRSSCTPGEGSGKGYGYG